MTAIKIALFSVIIAVVLSLRPGASRAQIFPDRLQTQVFRSYLRSLASGGTAAFVSRCEGPGRGEEAILVVPTAGDAARLVLFSSREVYSGAILKIENGRFVITEGSGGEWSDKRLHAFLNFLTKSTFRFVLPDKLNGLLTPASAGSCSGVRGNLPSSG